MVYYIVWRNKNGLFHEKARDANEARRLAAHIRERWRGNVVRVQKW